MCLAVYYYARQYQAGVLVNGRTIFFTPKDEVVGIHKGSEISYLWTTSFYPFPKD